MGMMKIEGTSTGKNPSELAFMAAVRKARALYAEEACEDKRCVAVENACEALTEVVWECEAIQVLAAPAVKEATKELQDMADEFPFFDFYFRRLFSRKYPRVLFGIEEAPKAKAKASPPRDASGKFIRAESDKQTIPFIKQKEAKQEAYSLESSGDCVALDKFQAAAWDYACKTIDDLANMLETFGIKTTAKMDMIAAK